MTQGGAPERRSASTAARTVFSLSTGSRICLIVGALLLVFAGYLFWAPLGHSVGTGFPARCGSAAHPPHDTLAKAVCGSVNDERRAQSLSMLVAAVIVVVGGVLAFGATRVDPRGTSSARE
jgi:hypothetical protein